MNKFYILDKNGIGIKFSKSNPLSYYKSMHPTEFNSLSAAIDAAEVAEVGYYAVKEVIHEHKALALAA